ncbi:hypothetical protein TIFTF001_053669, partial [Ficus carica]
MRGVGGGRLGLRFGSVWGPDWGLVSRGGAGFGPGFGSRFGSIGGPDRFGLGEGEGVQIVLGFFKSRWLGGSLSELGVLGLPEFGRGRGWGEVAMVVKKSAW